MTLATQAQNSIANAVSSDYVLPDGIRNAYENLGRSVCNMPDHTPESSYWEAMMEYKLILEAIEAGLPAIEKAVAPEKQLGTTNTHGATYRDVFISLAHDKISRCKSAAQAAMWFVENPCYPHATEVKEYLLILARSKETTASIYMDQLQLAGFSID